MAPNSRGGAGGQNLGHIYKIQPFVRKHLCLQHRYHIRVRPKGPCIGVGVGWTHWSMHGVGWDLRSRSGAFFFNE